MKMLHLWLVIFELITTYLWLKGDSVVGHVIGVPLERHVSGT